MNRAEESAGIEESLKRQNLFFRKQNEMERLGRCPECHHEPRADGGLCLKCRAAVTA